MKNSSRRSVLDPSKEQSAFEKAEHIRYQKLANAPVPVGPAYGELNWEGCTVKEILGYKV